MFNRLPESNARPQRRERGAVVSTIVHFVLIALAARATGLRATPVIDDPPVIEPLFVHCRYCGSLSRRTDGSMLAQEEFELRSGLRLAS